MYDHHYCYAEMPNENNKLLKYNQGERWLNVPAIIFADWDCLLEKMHLCRNNLKNSYTEKKIAHLMKQKANLIVTEGKSLWKGFVKT